MKRIGESTENPFKAGTNNVHINNISRTISIDLREILGETNIPRAIVAQNNILLKLLFIFKSLQIWKLF